MADLRRLGAWLGLILDPDIDSIRMHLVEYRYRAARRPPRGCPRWRIVPHLVMS